MTHVADLPSGHLYRPAFLGRPDESSQLPRQLRDALWHFLRARAELLMSAPGIEWASYMDHPAAGDLSEDEDSEIVCSNHYFSEFGWPLRWGQYRRALGKAEHAAYNHVNGLKRELRKDKTTDPEVLDVIDELLASLSNSACMHVNMRPRKPRNEYGVCVEDIRPALLACRVPEDVGAFATAAHNALIELMGWLDAELPRLKATSATWYELERKERDTESKVDKLLARERRHAAAVKKAKERLAKKYAEAEEMMAIANARMNEAMVLAELARKAIKDEVS